MWLKVSAGFLKQKTIDISGSVILNHLNYAAPGEGNQGPAACSGTGQISALNIQVIPFSRAKLLPRFPLIVSLP